MNDFIETVYIPSWQSPVTRFSITQRNKSYSGADIVPVKEITIEQNNNIISIPISSLSMMEELIKRDIK